MNLYRAAKYVFCAALFLVGCADPDKVSPIAQLAAAAALWLIVYLHYKREVEKQTPKDND